MQETLKKLQELVTLLQGKVSVFENGIKDNEALSAKLNDQDRGLVARAKELNAREFEIKKVESALELRDQAFKAKQDAQELLDALHNEKKEFEKYEIEERAKIAKELDALSLAKKKNENETALVQKEFEALRNEQKNWKAEFYKELKLKTE